MPYEAMTAFVRASSREMPPYREQVLPDNDFADIYAYLSSLKPGPDYKSIPLLNN
jgi:mono/diheme cytochrome c family protein